MQDYHEYFRQRELREKRITTQLQPITDQIIAKSKTLGAKQCEIDLAVGNTDDIWGVHLVCSPPRGQRGGFNAYTGMYSQPSHPKLSLPQFKSAVAPLLRPDHELMILPHTWYGAPDVQNVSIFIRPKSPDPPIAEVEAIANGVTKTLGSLGSTCNLDKLLGNQLSFDCMHDKSSGLFEPRHGEEDDDFPEFVGRDQVITTVKKTVKNATKIDAYPHEKGLYTVQFSLK